MRRQLARLLLPSGTVTSTFRRSAILLLALGGELMVPPPVGADSINLLRSGAARLAPSILIDSSTTIGTGVDDSLELIRDCVAISADVRGSWSRLRREWQFGRFAWEWEPFGSADIVYVICVERRGGSRDGGGGLIGGAGGGMFVAAPLAWNGRSVQTADGAGGMEPIADALPEVAAYIPPTGSDPASGTDGPASNAGSERSPQTVDPLTFATSALDAQWTASQIFGSGATDPVIGTIDAASFNAPVTLDPVYAPPVPEPGTWLLLGSGLAAAWRAAKKHR